MYARALRVWGVLAACGILLLGCTGGGDGGGSDEGTAGAATPKAGRSAGTDAGAGGGAGATGGDKARSAPGFDAAKQPKTRVRARELIRKVIPGPELFGPGVVRATPYEGDPGRWAVLGEDCVWQQRELPKNVLASLTRYFVLPAAGGKGAMRLSATVTVHRAPLDAAWEQARMLEEALGCEEQLLRPGERLTNLYSLGSVFGEGTNTDYDDQVTERGMCQSDTRGGPYPYAWHQVTLGPVVVSVSGCGGRGHTEADVWDPVGEAFTKATTRVEEAIGWDAGAPSGSPEAKVSPSASVPGTKGGA